VVVLSDRSFCVSRCKFCPLIIVSGVILFLRGLKLKLLVSNRERVGFFKLPVEAFPPEVKLGSENWLTRGAVSDH